jgi:hypothetical protein
MKPLLLGLHLERTHGCLKTLLEADSRPGIEAGDRGRPVLLEKKQKQTGCVARRDSR